MKRTIFFSLIGVGICCLASSQAFADASIIDSITSQYKSACANIASKMLNYAQNIFWILAAIQFIATGIKLSLSGSDIQEWAASIVRQILFIGIYAWLMENSYDFSMKIVDSFRQAGNDTALHPANLFSVGLKIAEAVSAMATSWNPFNGALVAICAVFIIATFIWIAAQVVVTLCEMYILISAGVLMMGFGGSEWTKDFANKTLLLVVGIGAKLLIMELLISTGWDIMSQWGDITYKTNHDIFTVMAGVGVFALLVSQLPNMAQQFISGAASGAMPSSAMKNMAQMAASAAIGATGVGMAYKAASSAAEGAGALAGASGTGAEGGAAGGAGGGGSSAGSMEVGAARMGGSAGSPAAQTGVALGQIGRALGQGLKSEVYGRMTGTGIRGGTVGGRVAHYIARSRETPPLQPANSGGPTEENRIG